MPYKQLLWLFAAIYLAVDISYVLASKKTYERVVVSIQAGKGFPSGRIMGAVLAYGALLAGWMVFAAPLAIRLQQSGTIKAPWLAGLAAGAMYGFVVYAVFNGTLYAMFHDYGIGILLRDLAWGTFWGSVLTAGFAWFASKSK